MSIKTTRYNFNTISNQNSIFPYKYLNFFSKCNVQLCFQFRYFIICSPSSNKNFL